MCYKMRKEGLLRHKTLKKLICLFTEGKAMKSLLKSFYQKKGAIGFASLLLLVSLSYWNLKTSSKLESLRSMANGLQTCFARVGQSFTAKIIGDVQSLYIDKNFVFETEECFAEENSLFESYFQKDNSALLKKMNSLNSDIHWFHQKILQNKTLTNEATDKSYLGERFSLAEDQVNRISDLIQEKLNAKNSLKSSLEFFLLVLFILTPTLFLIELWEILNKKKMLKMIDEKSFLEVGKGDDEFEHERVEGLIEQTFLIHEMKNSIKLFNRYQSHILNRGINRGLEPLKTEELNEGPAGLIRELEEIFEEDHTSERHLMAHDTLSKEEIDDLWENAPEKEIVEEGTNLEKLCESIMEIFKNRFFVKSISFSYVLPKNLKFVDFEKEVLEQVFYQLTLSCIRSCDSLEGKERYIRVNISGETNEQGKSFLIISFRDSGKLLEENSSDILIAKKLLEDYETEIALEVIKDQNDQIVRIEKKIMIPRNPEEKASVTVRDITKGKKRDLIREMES